MKNAHHLCRILILCVVAFPLGAHARMIASDQVLASVQAQTARTTLRETIRRSEVSAQLQSLGVGADAALARVNAMTDAEVASLAGHVDSLPAGSGTLWAIGVALLILELIIYFWID